MEIGYFLRKIKMGTITISVLLDNTSARTDLKCEHGLSFLIETPNGKILFDTGQTGLFAENAKTMGKNLSDCEHLVLSHGHYDHSGGIPTALSLNPKLKVWGHPDMMITRYSIKDPASPRSIGFPIPAKEALNKISFTETSSSTEIVEGVYATGEIPRVTSFEDTGGPFFVDAEGAHPDEIVDDQALWFVTPKGLVILFGCAHAGVVNTIRHCMEVSGVTTIHALIGGFHLLNASEARLEETYRFLESCSADIVAPCHCTGVDVIPCFQTRFLDPYEHCQAGVCFQFPLDF